ncbi:MAG: NAD-dependent epimerase/dehydratase family protein [Spirochaetales bacterium]|nr:NAD-dependent epimerase/dehydratase family protein [Spirochaetales bacterium]
MRVGITGSVGFLGANLVKYLRENGPGDLDIVCFFSSRTTNPLTGGLDLEYRHLDVTSSEDVAEKTRDLDALFHLAGAVDYSRQGARRTWDVNVLGAKNIFEAVLANRIPKLIYASSINVLGTAAGGGPADESNRIYGSPGNPISFRDRSQALAAVEASARGDYLFLRRSRVPYFDSKLAAYELALRCYRGSALPVRIVLPGTAVGAGDVGVSITQLVYRTFQGRLRLTLPGSTSFVCAEDVARGFWLACLRGESGQAYIITGQDGDNLSYREFMQRIVRVARTRYDRALSDRFLVVPAALCRPLATGFRLLSIEGALSEALILSGAAVHRFTPAKARAELGYLPKVALDKGIADCIDFFTQHGGDGAA